MMNIIQTISKEQLEARKNKDKFLSKILTTLLSEIKMVGKNKNRDTTEEEALKVIKKFKKDIEFSINNAKLDSNKLKELKKEANVYEKYLPKLMSKEELFEVINRFVNINSKEKSNIGSVMGYLNKNYKGLFEGKLASEITKKLLN